MKCCVPLCENTSENVSKYDRITFHRLPSEECLRTAWLQALRLQDSHVPDSAVVCSQHFLHDDINCETKSGSRHLRIGAVPSTLLVCMICLDTDNKMFSVSQYNLEEAYQKLTGHPLCDGGNLKLTLCVQCAQALRNFSRFRDKSLRARSLLMELLEKYELITAQHIKMIRHANHQLRNNLVSTILGPDPCDMYIKENSDEERQTDAEENVHGITVKTECSDDSQLDEDTQMIKKKDRDELRTSSFFLKSVNKENSECGKVEITLDPLEYESTQFMSTVCRFAEQEFPHELAYSAHVGMVPHSSTHPAAPSAHAVVTPLFANRTTNTGYEARTTETDATENGQRALITNSGASDNQTPDRTNTDIKRNIAKLYCILNPQNTTIKDESSTQSQAASSCDILKVHTTCKDVQYSTMTKDKAATTLNKPVASTLNETEPGTSGNSSRTRKFTCDVCQREFTRKYYLVTHMSTHTGVKPYSCRICSYKCASNSRLSHHMKTHTGEKPYSCQICSYKCTSSGNLLHHMKTHTGEKPYSCKICGYQSAQKRTLVDHMMTHTGEKPYGCEICSYKSTQKKNLVRHMRTHTGEKPYPCKICNHKSTTKSSLNHHMRTHTGEKPFSCTLCDYKCIQKGSLLNHMSTHTGEKPYSCGICGYKFAQKGSLVGHMRTHTGEKPYCCEVCGYKSSSKSTLNRHVMRKHL